MERFPDENEQNRLRIRVEQLQREGRSEQEIVAELNDQLGVVETARGPVLTRFLPRMRLRAERRAA